MLNRNVEEYKLIRQEMNNLKDCITKYIGYVLAGSGAMIYGLARMDRSEIPTSLSPEIAVVSASFSMLISLILLMLFYKFNSHNRFAGFCKLLNHERQDSINTPDMEHSQMGEEKKEDNGNDDKVVPLFSWEVTVGDLRWLESKPGYLGNIIKKIIITEPTKEVLREKIEERIDNQGKQPTIDTDKNFRGLIILVKTFLLRNTQTESWGFPPLVVCTFLFMVSGFLFASYFMTMRIGIFSNLWLLCYEIAITIFQLCLWWHICGKLYALMSGSATVYSFYWKFIPLRTLFLNKQKIKPSYISIGDYTFSDSNE